MPHMLRSARRAPLDGVQPSHASRPTRSGGRRAAVRFSPRRRVGRRLIGRQADVPQSPTSRPTQAPQLDHGAHARVSVGDQRVQVGAAPAQRVEAAQHVVADGDVDGAKLEGVQLEGLAVVGRGEEASDARDLAGVAGFGELQQPREGLGAFAGGLAGAGGERGARSSMPGPARRASVARTALTATVRPRTGTVSRAATRRTSPRPIPSRGCTARATRRPRCPATWAMC